MKRIYVRPKNSDARDENGWFHIREIAVTNHDGHIDVEVSPRRLFPPRIRIQFSDPDAQEFAQAMRLATTDEPPPSGEVAPNGRES